LDELRACLDLLPQAHGPEVMRRCERVLNRTDEQRERPVEAPAAHVDPPVAHDPSDLDGVDGVDVVDRLGLRVVAGRDVVAGHQADVPGPQRHRAHQVGLQCQAIPIPAGELDDGFHAPVQQEMPRGEG